LFVRGQLLRRLLVGPQRVLEALIFTILVGVDILEDGFIRSHPLRFIGVDLFEHGVYLR
jgi:hypothetical protein